MVRSALVVLTVLLVAGAVVGSVHALSDTSLQTDDESFVMLTLDTPSQDDQSTQSVDIARASGLQREAATNRIERYAYESRLEEGDREDQAVVRDELDRIENQIEDVRESKSALQDDYAQDRMDAETYLYELARFDARASHLLSRLRLVQDHAAERNLDTNRAAELESRLIGYHGPVRQRVRAALLGEAPAIRVEVKAFPNGTTLSMIEDGTHVREAYRFDRRTAIETGTIPSDELYGSFSNELVSEVYELDPQSTSIRGSGGGTYEVVIRAPRATPYLTLSAYVDGDTRQIFSEVQERQLDLLPPRESVVAAENGTRLAVNRSFPGGPLRITTADNTTGEPVSTVVTVNGEQFRTDSNGELWTLTPSQFEFPVTAVASSGNVSVDVRTIRVKPLESDP